MSFIETSSIRLSVHYVGQNVSYSCRTVLTLDLGLDVTVTVLGPQNAPIHQKRGRVSTLELVKGSTYQRILNFSPLSASDAGVYTCTGIICPRVANSLITNGRGQNVAREIRVFGKCDIIMVWLCKRLV